MATMYEKMMERLVDRIERQAVEIAELKHDKARLERLTGEMEYQRDQLIKLRLYDEGKMEDALDILESLAAEERVDLCVYQENALSFIQKWPATTGQSNGSKLREVASNGTH